ncbi:MAG: alpha-glucan family phosphorylase [Actinobacteria bacterium]|nr:alpha-glucan family phosphorylase [Actinomycetota bacterium]
MKAIRSFAVRASLPEPLRALQSIATNLRWSWNDRGVDLFRWVDEATWERSGHDPVRMLGLVPRERFDQLIDDEPFMAFLAAVAADLERYLREPRWYQAHTSSPPLRVAYFSPEFAITEALPTYSGGLGVLAGDHLKAASDLGIPMVGVGLLYRQGYFRQQLSSDGWQLERYPSFDPHDMPLTLMSSPDGAPLKIEVDMAGVSCAAQIWLAKVGRVGLLLLDCDIEDNGSFEREVTDRLYAGGSEHRLRQEIVLGIGGVKALKLAGYKADVYHSNEGHAGFMGLERIRELVWDHNLSWQEAIEAVRAGTVFTTHTPVPAGIDVYERDLMERYFSSFAKECGVSFDELNDLGSPPSAELPSGLFNMAIMGFRLAGRANAVSKLHGEVSRVMFGHLWPEVPHDEAPISSVTNGVHTSSWLGPEMAEVLGRRLPPGWAESVGARWEKVSEIPDLELWRARERARERLVYFVRRRLRAQSGPGQASPSESAWIDEVFDPGVLTIGFARRFAQYKRATLMLSDPDRLKSLLLSSERPIQIVLAGKAHPRDDGGKELIRQLVHFSRDSEVRGRFAFIEDYDMEVGRMLTQGVDVWLNNPRRPLEACGTSGMKAALNGALNCSVLDGWWDELYDGENGWAIGSREPFDDLGHQDLVDADALFDLLESEIIPRFYDLRDGSTPRRWVQRMKRSIATLGPAVTADRMLRDYTQHLYEPAARQGETLSADGFSHARALAAWALHIAERWDDVSVLEVEGEEAAAGVGEQRSVTAKVRMGRLQTEDLCVQLAHGRVGAAGELLSPELVNMAPEEQNDGVCLYRGVFTTEAPGLYGYAVRVLPSHQDLSHAMDLGLVTWA